MKLYRRVTILLFMQLVWIPVLAGQQRTYRTIQDPEAYEIYSIVAEKVSGSSLSDKAKGYSIIQTTSSNRPTDQSLAQCFPAKYAATFRAAFADYTLSNQEPMLLGSGFRLSSPYELLTEDELAQSFPKSDGLIENWKRFYKRHPRSSGFLRFSRIGFNQDRTQAVVSVVFSCDWLCALDTDYMLQKSRSGWHVLSAQSQCRYIS
jgi:hypothetical protein